MFNLFYAVLLIVMVRQMYVCSFYYYYCSLRMNPKDVYTDFIVELTQQLKMKDSLFIALLTKHRLFFGELKAKVREQSTEAEASSLFLQEAIERPLEMNDVDPFMKLLSSMEEFGGPLEKLSTDMRKRLNSLTTESQSTDILGKYLIHIFVYMYHIYPNKSRAHINAWARISAGIQCSKEIDAYVKYRKGSYKCLVKNCL